MHRCLRCSCTVKGLDYYPTALICQKRDEALQPRTKFKCTEGRPTTLGCVRSHYDIIVCQTQPFPLQRPKMGWTCSLRPNCVNQRPCYDVTSQILIGRQAAGAHRAGPNRPRKVRRERSLICNGKTPLMEVLVIDGRNRRGLALHPCLGFGPQDEQQPFILITALIFSPARSHYRNSRSLYSTWRAFVWFQRVLDLNVWKSPRFLRFGMLKQRDQPTQLRPSYFFMETTIWRCWEQIQCSKTRSFDNTWKIRCTRFHVRSPSPPLKLWPS